MSHAHMVAPAGDIRVDMAAGSLTLQAVNVEAHNIDLQADAVSVIEDHDFFTSYTSEGKSQTTHIEKRSVGSRLSARGQVFLRSLKEALTLQHVTMKAERATLFSGCGMIRWLLGTNMSQTITTTKSSNFLWSKMRQDYQEHHTYSRNDTSGVKTFVIETPADRATTIMVQEVEGYTSELIHQLKDLPGDIHVEQMLVREVHTYSSIKQWSLSKAAVAIVALGVMLVTQGTAGQLAASLSEMAGLAGAGATIATGATTAGMVSAAQTAAISLIQNDMDVGKVLGDVRKLAGSRGFVATVVEGGLLPGHNAATLGGAVGNEIDRALLRKAITNEDIRPESIASGAAANYIQAAGSTAISGMKADQRLNATEQVLLHGAVHGVAGAVRGIPDGSDAMIRSAALSASAAMAAETLANILIDPSKKAGELVRANPDMSDDELEKALRDSFTPTRNAIQLMVAAGGLLNGDERSVSLMARSAGIALDYNTFGPYGMAAAAAAARLAQAKDAFVRGATAVNQASQATARVLTSTGRAIVNAAKDAFKGGSDKVLQLPYKGGRYAQGTVHNSNVLVDAPKLLRGSQANAGNIPLEIGKALDGKTFKSFNEFRSSFWEAVSKSRYAGEFGSYNLGRIQRGLAPEAPVSQWIGKGAQVGQRGTVYELHHKIPLHQGGATYDLSNVLITTPRFHLEILEKATHYKK